MGIDASRRGAQGEENGEEESKWQPDGEFTSHAGAPSTILVYYGIKFKYQDKRGKRKEEGGCGDDQEGARKIKERLTE